jgi:FMN reductase
MAAEDGMTRLVGVLGSVTGPGRLALAVSGALDRALAAGHEVERIDLSRLRLDFADGRPLADHDDDSVALVRSIERADAVLLASPVYRASLTGALKNALDLTPVEALRAKPVGIIAMGATMHHYLGVDSHLRDILAWFGALVAPVSVYLASSDFVERHPSAAAEKALDDLVASVATLAERLRGTAPGPPPLAAGRG